MEAYLTNVNLVYYNASFSRFNNPKNCLYQSWFPTACPSYNTHFLPSWEGATDILQDIWEMVRVTDLQKVETH